MVTIFPGLEQLTVEAENPNRLCYRLDANLTKLKNGLNYRFCAKARLLAVQMTITRGKRLLRVCLWMMVNTPVLKLDRINYQATDRARLNDTNCRAFDRYIGPSTTPGHKKHNDGVV